jgi:teichuronic acid biosynthesis glycosyltransferase TuaG
MLYKNNLVTIIMPAYKAAKYIEESIESVLSQTYQTWELIIVDDCSPDATREIISKYASRDKRIKPIFLKKNSGPAVARNEGLKFARGRWIAFLDSDDIWISNKLSLQKKFQLKTCAVLTFTQFRRVSADKAEIGHLIDVPDKLDYRELLGNTVIATSTVLVDRSLLKTPIKMKKVYYDDFVCWLDLLRDGAIAYGFKEDLMRYRVLKKSVSRNKINSAIQIWKIYRNYLNLNIFFSFLLILRWGKNALLKYYRF